MSFVHAPSASSATSASNTAIRRHLLYQTTQKLIVELMTQYHDNLGDIHEEIRKLIKNDSALFKYFGETLLTLVQEEQYHKIRIMALYAFQHYFEDKESLQKLVEDNIPIFVGFVKSLDCETCPEVIFAKAAEIMRKWCFLFDVCLQNEDLFNFVETYDKEKELFEKLKQKVDLAVSHDWSEFSEDLASDLEDFASTSHTVTSKVAKYVCEKMKFQSSKRCFSEREESLRASQTQTLSNVVREAPNPPDSGCSPSPPSPSLSRRLRLMTLAVSSPSPLSPPPLSIDGWVPEGYVPRDSANVGAIRRLQSTFSHLFRRRVQRRAPSSIPPPPPPPPTIFPPPARPETGSVTFTVAPPISKPDFERELRQVSMASTVRDSPYSVSHPSSPTPKNVANPLQEKGAEHRNNRKFDPRYRLSPQVLVAVPPAIRHYCLHTDMELDSETLGWGAVGEAFLVHLHDNPTPMVVKKFNTKQKKYVTEMIKELSNLIECGNHTHIVQLYGLVCEDQEKMIPIGILLENMDCGTLSNTIHNPEEKYGEKEVLEWGLQAASALLHVHENGFIHRDVKSENFLLTRTGRRKLLKLADFGTFTKETAESRAGVKSWCGTQYYVAPEAHPYSTEECTPAVDIYSLGITLWELAQRKAPYKEENLVFEDEERTIKRPSLENPVYGWLPGLLKRMWAEEALDRPSIKEVYSELKQLSCRL